MARVKDKGFPIERGMILPSENGDCHLLMPTITKIGFEPNCWKFPRNISPNDIKRWMKLHAGAKQWFMVTKNYRCVRGNEDAM